MDPQQLGFTATLFRPLSRLDRGLVMPCGIRYTSSSDLTAVLSSLILSAPCPVEREQK